MDRYRSLSNMKILRITSLGYEAGGSDNGIILLTPILREMGHEVEILASDRRPDMPHFNTRSYPSLEDRPLLVKLLYRAFYPHAYFATRKALKEFKPDIVQIHTMFETSPSVLFALRGVPTVVTIHGAEDFTPSLMLWSFPTSFFKPGGLFDYAHLNTVGWLHYLYHTYINGTLYRIGFRFVDRFIVFSKYMQTLLRPDGISAVLIPNATRLFPYTPIDEKSKIIAYVGRLEKIKGVQDIITALPSILLECPDATLHIAGTGTYENELKALVSSMNLTNQVVFLGHRTREELRVLYEKCGVFVIPSIWPEPFGKVGIEAMSVGRPVIGTDVGGISEWLTDGEVGYLIPPERSDMIAEKIITLFKDPALLTRFSKHARTRAEEFSIELHATRVIALYSEVIAEAKNKISN